MDNYPQTTLKYFFKIFYGRGEVCVRVGSPQNGHRFLGFFLVFFFKFFISTLNDAEVLLIRNTVKSYVIEFRVFRGMECYMLIQ